MSCDLEQSVFNELNMCLESPLSQEAVSSSSEFIPNVMIPSCWAGVNYPIFTFDNNYHIQISIVMVFNTDSSMVLNKYEEAKRVWEEYAELEQKESETEKVQRKLKNMEMERKNKAELDIKETRLEKEEMKGKSECLNNVLNVKNRSNGQLIEELARNENFEINDEDTLKNEDTFNSEDLDSSNEKTKTSDDSINKSQMDDDKWRTVTTNNEIPIRRTKNLTRN